MEADQNCCSAMSLARTSSSYERREAQQSRQISPLGVRQLDPCGAKEPGRTASAVRVQMSSKRSIAINIEHKNWRRVAGGPGERGSDLQGALECPGELSEEGLKHGHRTHVPPLLLCEQPLNRELEVIQIEWFSDIFVCSQKHTL